MLKREDVKKEIVKILKEKGLYLRDIDDDISELTNVTYEYLINLDHGADEVIKEVIEALTLQLDLRFKNDGILH